MFKKFMADKLLSSLDNIERGSLTLTTPDGKERHFQGAKDGPKADLTIHNWGVFINLALKGDEGFAHDYRLGHWDSNDLISLVEFALINRNATQHMVVGNSFLSALSNLSYFFKRNSVKGSKENIHAHYDLGNEFYKLWLDPSMTYSAAIFKNEDESLLDAQHNKYDRIINRLEKPSGSILEIGCGWGGFAERSQSKGDYAIKGITLSEEQHDYAQKRLQNNAKIALEDYRHQDGKYDSIVSIEMFEAVGEQYWPTYFSKVGSLLKDNGKAVVQTITMNEEDYDEYRSGSDFIRSYIFPGGMLPSPFQFKSHASKAGLKIGNTFSFGQDYGRTLKHWLETFDQKKNDVKALGFDDGFIRLWRFYLAACVAGFKTERTDVMQIELIRA